jgi:hypothetical protein
MVRFLAGAGACLLLIAGAFLIWQGHAEQRPQFPSAPAAQAGAGASLFAASTPLKAPEASPKSREERRFSRADKNKDGKIEEEEVLAARHKAFAKLDANGNGSLSFEEWAAKTINKFDGADSDRNGWLTPAEYATTAPPPPKHQRCSC